MSKEKQIEEMAKVFCGMKNGCDGCMWDKAHCHERNYAEEIYDAGYRKIPDNIGEFSDGYHTFNELYHHRAVLFSVICNMFPEKSWKSKLHDTGDMFDGMFIVGIETEYGQATYHYDIEPYWDMFKVKELEKAPKWDGHTSSDAIERIGNMSVKGYRKQSENVIELPCKIGDTVYIIDEADDEYGEDYALAVKVLQFFINKHGIAVDLALPLGMRQNTWMVVGKNVFLTREEAEAHMRKEDEGK